MNTLTDFVQGYRKGLVGMQFGKNLLIIQIGYDHVNWWLWIWSNQVVDYTFLSQFITKVWRKRLAYADPETKVMVKPYLENLWRKDGYYPDQKKFYPFERNVWPWRQQLQLR